MLNHLTRSRFKTWGRTVANNSVKPFFAFEWRIASTEGRIETEQLAGCQACIVRLPCGGKLVTNLKAVRADTASCKNKSVLRLDVKIAGPPTYLMNSLPAKGELPHQPNLETAERSLKEEVQNRMAPRVEALN